MIVRLILSLFRRKVTVLLTGLAIVKKNQGYCIEFEEGEFFNGVEGGLPAELFARCEDVNYADSESFAAGLGEVISTDWIISTMLDAQKAAYLLKIDIHDQNSEHTDNFLHRLSHDLMHKLFTRMMYSSCSYKSEGFLHESERRLMLLEKNMNPVDGAQPNRKFRERNGAIFPYTSLGFNKHSIKSILIGPCSDYEFKRAGLLKLLNSQGMECEVKQSASSLRFN
ncbi:hypothetical protein [Pseudomonas amygdali]|uniref:hypothetical protein n=1 Tax=Pseudomonas amygdali TaxID=47877 RepID=UPI0005C84193|nr:hypothetical protein [Pseudomonas amygdali]